MDLLMHAWARCYAYLFGVFQNYANSVSSMNRVLGLEWKGDIEKCLRVIVKYATSILDFFAKEPQAMKGAGTCH